MIEFNARFGDPETQVVLARLRTPLGGLLLSAATGRLADQPPLRWSEDAAVTVVLAARDYPGTPRTGDPIGGLAEAGREAHTFVHHAGTGRDTEGRVVSAGGRVLSVTSTGPDLAVARARAYEGLAHITLDGSHHRTDIARQAAGG